MDLCAVHIDLRKYVPRADYLESLFERVEAAGYNAALIAYEERFPYASYPELAGDGALSSAEIAAIDAAAERHGLDVIPVGFQFSHADGILRHDRFRSLDAGGRALDLTRSESVDVLVRTGEEFLDAHPRARILHCGGDEIWAFGATARTSRAVRDRGISGYYVDYVNRLAERFAHRGVRVAIWSDMLIRHPEAIESLDRSVLVFYWDYWGSGDRTPFVSIGGGMPDMALFDRARLEGDARKLFLMSCVRPGSEIPVGHLDRFAHYWELDPARTSAKSFPYARWFSELGFSVVGAILPYPEKSTFLPDYLGKMEHVRAFARRLHEAKAAGFVACLWQPHWPLLATAVPSLLTTGLIAADPALPTDDVLDKAARQLGVPWTTDTLRAYLGVGRDFEAADTLSPEWTPLSLGERFTWIRETGAWSDDMELCRGSLARAEALLATWPELSTDSYERLVLDDLAWRARVQIGSDEGDSGCREKLLSEGRALAERFARHAGAIYKTCHVPELHAARYAPWLDWLGAAP
jgi:hypothetical protein